MNLIKYKEREGFSYYWVNANNVLVKFTDEYNFRSIEDAMIMLSRNLVYEVMNPLGQKYVDDHFVGTEKDLRKQYPEYFI